MNARILAGRLALMLFVCVFFNACSSRESGDDGAESDPTSEQNATNHAPGQEPWIVLSDFTLESGGLNNTAKVSYRFVQGEPQPNQDYYLFVEESSSGGSARYWDEKVKLNAAGGTLTMEVGASVIRDRAYTFITSGPRSTTYSDPEPQHLSGNLYLGQSESSATPLAPDQSEATPEKIGITAVLKNSRHTSGTEGELISIDYEISQLPEATGFWLTFIGSEGGSVSYDVEDDIRAAPKSGTLSRPVPDPQVLLPPYEVKLKCQPFGADTGTPFDTVAISETISVE
jgi:hypothetical protein